MDEFYYISSDVLDIETIFNVVENKLKLRLSDEAKINIERCRKYLDNKIGENKKPIYGINTGFGSLCNVTIDEKHLSTLQENLVMSHACGTGEKVPTSVVKLMLLLKIQSLSYGHSGVQLDTVLRLIDFYNEDVLPVVYTQGSLGASGDLAPLAHLALPLLGKGEVYYEGKITASETVLKKKKWKPIVLQSKEGLAMLNGTQFMSAYGVWCIMNAYRLSYLADLIGTISLDAFDGLTEPFHRLIHLVRPHKGQIKTAERILRFIEGSEIAIQKKTQVQDPYSFRCMPQVHGASKDALAYVRKVFKTEMNSVTDNPNIFVDQDEVLSGGNFHGQPLAMALDYLGIALAEWGSISERRTYQLISGQRGLPSFLVNDPGLNSGLMIPQYTAASIVSQNKQLATPASVDSIVSSNGQEDHVSMGANAATKCFKIMENLKSILAIELLTASQALAFRRPMKSSSFIEDFCSAYTEKVSFVDKDRIFHNDIQTTIGFLETVELNAPLFQN
ncbi:histidine ammonia-lyase [Galbibacter sp. EGI 63066]|uniref:histidine ammonia-lyase n=1 Tax=Galbibacter sp. EGI 63066 TaxID=2993559 RepID=UPI0022497D70|nr:histidine ammonia-lyase [Galbibacter sp. EGI 63066]MCX2680873.1 histidine ammonia-lyase [Galbibacter sp. EGI 63066]